MRARRQALVVVAILLSVATRASSAEPAIAIKYATSPDLRAVMGELRKTVINHHTLITHRRLPKASAVVLAGDLRRTAHQLRGNAGGEGDAILTQYATELERGADAIAGAHEGRSALDGLFDLVGVLESYPVHFDHPGWKGLQDQ